MSFKFEEFQIGSHGSHLGYCNRTILGFVNLHVVLMPPANFFIQFVIMPPAIFHSISHNAPSQFFIQLVIMPPSNFSFPIFHSIGHTDSIGHNNQLNENLAWGIYSYGLGDAV